MWFRVLPKATLSAVVIVAVCFIAYIVFFHKYDPTANNIGAKQLHNSAIASEEHLAKAMDYLKSKNYQEAWNIVVSDFLKFSDDLLKKSPTIQQEESVYYYCQYMLAADDEPIKKYANIAAAKPIPGILTQAEIDQGVAKWKPLSEAASANNKRLSAEALDGLTEDEKRFVEVYSADSEGGKKLNPVDEASKALGGGTLVELKKKTDKWMNDPRILQAIEKYKTVPSK